MINGFKIHFKVYLFTFHCINYFAFMFSEKLKENMMRFLIFVCGLCEFNSGLKWETGTPNLPNCNKNSAGGYNSNTNTIWIFGGKCGVGSNDPNIFSYNIDTQNMSSHGVIQPNQSGFTLLQSGYITLDNIVYVHTKSQIHSFNMITQEYKTNIASNLGGLTASRSGIIIDAPTLILYDETQGMFILTSDIKDIEFNATWDGPYFANKRHNDGCGIYSNTGFVYLFTGRDTNTIERININDLDAGFSYVNSTFPKSIQWTRCVKTYDMDTNDEIVYILGGQFHDATHHPINHVYKYDVTHDALVRDSNMNSVRENGVAFIIHNIIYYFGGEDGIAANNTWGTGADTFIFAQLPTVTPTVSPTTFPTNAPTHSPTNSPTTSPINSPTKLPTTFPTNQPSEISISEMETTQDGLGKNTTLWNELFNTKLFLVGGILLGLGCIMCCLVFCIICKLKKKQTIKENGMKIPMTPSNESPIESPSNMVIDTDDINENNRNGMSDSEELYEMVYSKDPNSTTTTKQ